MTNLILTSSFKRAFKAIIKREPNLKPKIEAKLRLLADNQHNPNSY
ncbi:MULTISPECIES: plasmid stabilization system protein [unclassified Moorena]|nr:MULTISPECIES: plasmid stabilization system protein [unclassified Moorena]NEQ09534.1 plasmid stabilization system protein [Moorena sp. SIO4E2]NER88734.1 plasmid stabilization system protein [Moorena sp. SIO3A2]NES41259.1 plasmid stabilization system protein [Moorena sp. SIO2C4]